MTAAPDLDPGALQDLVARTLAEDLDTRGDVTSAAVVEPDAIAAADFVARASGVIAGTAAATEVFRQVDPEVTISWEVADGDAVAAGTVLGRVHGALRSILTAERSALNLLAHSSGIATLTRAYVDLAAGRTQIRDTRKTTPGLRLLDKAAVRAGGGVNHRTSLSDAVLIKDNHLSQTSIAEAVARARAMWPDLAVEVECDTADQVTEARAAGADAVLLDNMTPAQVAAVMAELDGALPVEVSGGVTFTTLDAYAAARPTFIAIGALTHSAPNLDIALDVEPEDA